MILSNLLLSVPLAQNAGGGILVPILIVFGIFYVLVLRPQAKERREREQKIQTLDKYTKVVTNAGIHGTVMSTDEDTVTLRVDEKNDIRMKFAKAAIWQILDGDEKSPGKGKSGGKSNASGGKSGAGGKDKGAGDKSDK